MKKSVSALAATAIAMAGVASMSSAPALSQSANAATVSKDLTCGGFVPTADGGIGAPIFTDNGRSVVTSSGNTSVICHFDIPEGSEPARATRAEGFSCGTFLGNTTDTKMVATPGGKATLTCKINGS